MIPEHALVYVVDDDASFVRSAVRLLASWGIEAEGFTSAHQLLARGPGEGPECALVDLRMPGVDGRALQEALARAGRPLPVVLMSGHTDPQSRVEAMRSGAVDFVTKPVDEQRLLAALELAFASALADADGALPDAALPGPRRRAETHATGFATTVEPGLATY